MKLPLSCADFTFPLLEHAQSLQLIATLGFDGVDIGLFEGRSHLQPSSEFRNPVRSGKRLAAQLDRLGLKAADVFLQTAPDFAFMAPNHPSARKRAKARDMFLQTLDYARACRTSHVSALPGIYFPQESPKKSWDRCVGELLWRVERAREADCEFAVEAHLGSLVPKPADVLRLIHDVPGLTLTLDYTHFAYQGIPCENAHGLLVHASHFHLRGARKKRLQASFKNNVINYRKVLKMMKKSGYKGYVGVEYVWIDWQGCNEVDNLSETILWRNFLIRELHL